MLLTLELALVATALLVALAARSVPGSARLKAILRPLINRPARGMLAIVALAALPRLLLLPALGIPDPRVHDEHSLLLQAQSFVAGRFATPSHPLWPHFETFHVNVQPAHASIYFPGRGLPAAIGLWLADEPWLGVWLSVALLAGATFWMLRAYVPPAFALLGSAIAALRFGVFSYWINTYWGGAFTALGGVLVLGALPRLWRAPRWRDGALLAVGVLILMTTRPFEGLLFCLPVAAALLARLAGLVRRRAAGAALRLSLPSMLAVVLGLGVILAYNTATTADPFLTPYSLNRDRYALAPALLTTPALTPPEHPDIRFRRFYEWEALAHARRKTAAGVAGAVAAKLSALWRFYVGPALTLPFLIGAAVLARRRRVEAAAAVAVVTGFLASSWDFPHYAAPAYPVAILAVTLGLSKLWGWTWRDRPAGRSLATALPAIGTALLLVPASSVIAGWPRLPSNHWNAACCAIEPRTRRGLVRDQLHAAPGADLVIVRYRPGDPIHDEWVYNAPDPDAADIVWARDLGPARNVALRRRFADRRQWLVDGIGGPDGGRLRRLAPATTGRLAGTPDLPYSHPDGVRHVG